MEGNSFSIATAVVITFYFLVFPHTASAYEFQHSLGLGSQGNEVIELQQILKTLHFYTYPEITGYFGPATEAAVEAFQSTRGIVSTGNAKTTGFGRAGQQTIAALNQTDSASASPISPEIIPSFGRDLEYGAQGEDVQQLQHFLNLHGFAIAVQGPGSPGNETTYFGRATQAALAKFQDANRIIPAEGVFGPLTRVKVLGLLFATLPSINQISTNLPSAAGSTTASTIPAVSRIENGSGGGGGGGGMDITVIPAKLAFGTQPVNITIGTILNPFVTVLVQNSNGDNLTFPSNPVSLSLLEATTSSGTLTGDLTATSASGVATFNNLTVGGPGSISRLIATSPALTSATSLQFSVLPTGVSLAFNPPAVNACKSTYDQFYGSEPGVYAYWPLCETTPIGYDYVGMWSFVGGFGSGAVLGGQPGPVADGETASYISTDSAKLEKQDFTLNKNQGTIATWINTDAPAFPVAAMFFSAVGASSAVTLETHASSTDICFDANWTNASSTTFTASKCGYGSDTWHRIAETWNAGTLTLYVDGSAQATSTYTGSLDNTVFYYQLFPGCCDTGKQMTLAKALVANQAWNAGQVASDYSPTLIAPPAGGVYVTQQQLGTIHKDVLGYADYNSDMSSSTVVNALKAGLTAAGVTSARYAGGYEGIQADEGDWQNGTTQCTLASGVTQASQNISTGDTIDTYIPRVAQALGLDIGYTVNYGTNPPACNAGGDPTVNGANLVTYLNITKGYGVKYFEIGNEQFSANTEADFHSNPHQGSSYATYEPAFYDQMKAVDPTIQIAVPVFGPGDYDYEVNYGYPVLSGAKYDAIVYHPYPIIDPITDGDTLYPDRVTANRTSTRGELLTYQTLLLNAGKPKDALWLTEWNGEPAGNEWSRQVLGAAAPLFVVTELSEFMDAGVPYATWQAQGAGQSGGTDVCSVFNYDYGGETAYNWVDGCGFTPLVYTSPHPGVGEVAVGFKPGDLTPAGHGFQILSESGFVTEGEHMLRTQIDLPNAPWLASYAATHGSSYAVILINRDRDYAHTVPVTLAGQSSGASITAWTYGRDQYDQSYYGNWNASPVESALGAWSGSFQAALPPWSVNVFVFGN